MRTNPFFILVGLCSIVSTRGLAAAPASPSKLVLVENGVSLAPIVIANDSSPDNREAAHELARYIHKVSGVTPEILTGAPAPLPARAIWVGRQPALTCLFPGLYFDFKHPEETLMAATTNHVVIAGRDRWIGTNQVEHGTVNAVCTFIEKRLNVRWLWPGELGEDVVRQPTLAFNPFEERFHPAFRKRHLWPRTPSDWYRHQRIWFYSYPYAAGHAFTNWWDQYHGQHPEWFALRGTTRTPEKWGDTAKPEAVKLCVSNPEVVEQWLKTATATLLADPTRMVVSATPNDGGGFCTCTNCRAWDSTNGPPVWGYVALTDRYVRFWNILARGLRKRFPDREVYVGVYAYSTYRTPPVAEVLEPNIAVGYVGQFPLAGDAAIAKQKAEWVAWSRMATRLVFRPNLFHSSAGFSGVPNVAIRKTIDAFRFLADNKCVGIEVDTLPNSWATQGPQYYLMAQLAYDPYQDGVALMKDYYRRGFGPAARTIEEYFALMEHTFEASLAKIWLADGSRLRKEALAPVFAQVWGDEAMHAAGKVLMDRAAAESADGPAIYRQRVAFIRTGFDFTVLQARLMRVMARVEESRYGDPAAVAAAIRLHEERRTLYEKAEPYAIRVRYGVKALATPEKLLKAARGTAVITPAPAVAPDDEGRL